MGYKVYINWNYDTDRNDWEEITDYTHIQLKKIESLHNSLKSTRDILNLSIAFNQTLYNKFLENPSGNLIWIKVEKDSNLWFKGVVRENFNFSITQNPQSMNLEAIDSGELLEQKIDETLLYENFYIYNSTNTSTSLIHKLLEKAGYDLSLDIGTNNDILTQIDIVYISGTETYRQVLDKVLIEFGYTFRFDENGQFILINLKDVDTSTATDFQNSNMFGSLQINKKKQTYDTAKVIWVEHKTYDDHIVFSDTTGGDDKKKASIDVDPGNSYPVGSDSEDVYCNYTSDVGDLVIVKNPTLDISTSGGSLTQIKFTNYFKKLLLQLKNNTSSTITITKMDVIGDLVVKGAKSTAVSTRNSNSKKILTYNSEYIHNSTDAMTFADYLSWFYAFSDFTYITKSDLDLELGEIVHITDSDTGLDTYGRIVKKTFESAVPILTNQNQWIYEIEGIDDFHTSTSTSTNKSQNSSTTQTTIVNQLVENTPTYEEITCTGYDTAGGTTTPAKLSWLTAQTNYRTITLSWEKQWNLTNWDRYEIQVSEDGSNWYDFEGNSGGTTKVYQETTTFVGDFDNGNPKTYYFRVRQVTKTGDTSDWSDLVSKDTNPIGYNQDGMIYFDNNNYWDLTNGNFRIGDVNKYIYFDGNNVYFSSVDAEFTNAGVSVYNSSKTIQENVRDGKISWNVGDNYADEASSFELQSSSGSSAPTYRYIKVCSCSVEEYKCTTAFFNHKLVFSEIGVYDTNGCNVALCKNVDIDYTPFNCDTTNRYDGCAIVNGQTDINFGTSVSCCECITGSAIIDLGACYQISNIKFYEPTGGTGFCTKFCQLAFYGSCDCCNWTQIKASTDYTLAGNDYISIQTYTASENWLKLNGSLQLNCSDYCNVGFMFSCNSFYVSADQKYNPHISKWTRINSNETWGGVLTVANDHISYRMMKYTDDTTYTAYMAHCFVPRLGGDTNLSGYLCWNGITIEKHCYPQTTMCWQMVNNNSQYYIIRHDGSVTCIKGTQPFRFIPGAGGVLGCSCFVGPILVCHNAGNTTNSNTYIHNGYINFSYSGKSFRLCVNSAGHGCFLACSAGSYTDNAFNYYIWSCGWDYHHGALNSGFWHHHTDRKCFYWNKPCYACGGFHTYSDIRTKTDIKDYEDDKLLDKINQLKVREYSRICYVPDDTGFAFFPEKTTECEIGLVAQETYTIMPEVVSKPSNEIVDLWSIKETELQYVMLKSIQCLISCVDKLESCIKKLGG